MIELVVDLYRLDVAELFQIQCNQVGDVEIFPARNTGTLEVDMCHIADDLQFGEPCKTVIDGGISPAVFRCAGALEIFFQNAFG